MTTRKSPKPSKTKSTKTIKTSVDHNHIGKCFVAFGLIITALFFGIFYLIGQRKTNLESQKVQAFDNLVREAISAKFSVDGEQTAEIGNTGITKDGDLYTDFTIVKYENNVPTAKQPARIHFQCQNRDSSIKGCAHAYWYGDWQITSDEYRSAYREFLDLTEAHVKKSNAATTDEERELLEKEYTEQSAKLIELIQSLE